MGKTRGEYFKGFKFPTVMRAAKSKKLELPAPPEPVLSSPVTEYKAYGVATGPGKPQRLEIRSAKSHATALLYANLAEIIYDQRDYAWIMLLFPGNLVTIKGRNLKPLVDALLTGTCAFLQKIGEDEQAGHDMPVINEMTSKRPPRPAGPAQPQEPGRILH